MSHHTIKNRQVRMKNFTPKFGMAPDMQARFAAGDLGLERSAMSLQRLAPNVTQPFGHHHKGQEELYVAVVDAGSGRVKLDDEIYDVGAWDAVRVAPDVTRALLGRARRARVPRVRRPRGRRADGGRGVGAGLVERQKIIERFRGRRETTAAPAPPDVARARRCGRRPPSTGACRRGRRRTPPGGRSTCGRSAACCRAAPPRARPRATTLRFASAVGRARPGARAAPRRRARVPAQVRKSLAVKSSPATSRR